MDAYEERVRPAVWGPVLIAAVFLAIIGGSAGWIAANQANAEDRAAQEQQRDPGAGAPDDQRPVAPEPTADDGGGNDGGNDGGGRDEAGPDACPRHLRELAGRDGAEGSLELVLYLRTTRSHVWICRDGSGRLFYQGFRGKLGTPMREGDNALYLTDVGGEGDTYVATNRADGRTTTYRVSREALVITDGDGKSRTEPAA